MEVFYLKINRPTPVTWHYLKMWLDITQEFPETKTYIICDNPAIQDYIKKAVQYEGYDVEFITSARNSEELRYIVDNAIISRWHLAAYAHLTTFIHARDNGYKNFWNIDADDIGLYAKPRKIAKVLKNVKDYAIEKSFGMFSLDIWRTITQGWHWSFGVVYTNNASNCLELMKSHCKDKELFKRYGNVSCGLNLDCYCSYLKEIGTTRIETFCIENLRVIHNSNDVYHSPIYGGLRHWKNGRLYLDVLCNAFAMGEAGSLPVPKDIINFDVGITEIESISCLKNKCTDYSVTTAERLNGIIDSEITVILPLYGVGKICQLCLESLLEQKLKNFRVIVTDAGLNETALKTCREFESKFNGRMKIITGLKKENFFSAGLQAAKGRYVIFITGKEFFVPQAFEFFHEVIENTNADVFHLSRYFFPNENNELILGTDESGLIGDSSKLKFLRHVKEKVDEWKADTLSPSIFNKLIRREFLEEEKISMPFTDVMTQWTFSLQCLMLAENYVRVPQPLYVRTSPTLPPNYIKDFPAQIKSLAKCYEALDKLDDEVFYFDEYAGEKNFLKNLFNKTFVNEV